MKPLPKYVEDCLNRCSLLFSRPLEPETINIWSEFLSPYGKVPIEYAFTKWNESAKWFPKPKDILELIQSYRVQNRVKYQPCGQDGCMDGWVQVFTGTTAGGNPVDPVMGAVTRCHCFRDYMSGVRV